MDITPRADWGAAPPKGDYTPAPWTTGMSLWVHHTVGNAVPHEEPGMPGPNYFKRLAKYPADVIRRMKLQRALHLAAKARTIDAEKRAMREIQAFHQNTRGWLDIGYHHVVFDSGRVYQGRPPEVVGAHCPGHNTEPSVSLAGDYSVKPPSLMQMHAVHELRRHLGAARLKGHRDGFPTACPGDAAYHAFGLDK